MAQSMSRQVHTVLAVTVIVIAAALPLSAAADEIFKWVDENGVVHFNESLPEEIAAPVETMYIESTNRPGYDPDDYYWSVVNQAERIGEDWDELQEAKAEELVSQRTNEAEQRLTEIERRLAADEQSDYDLFRPVYGPFAFANRRHHMFFGRGFHDRFHHGHHDRHGRGGRSPHHSRDGNDMTSDPRAGWSAPQPPARPSTPGFRGSTNR